MVIGDKTGKYSVGIYAQSYIYNRINWAHFLRCLSVGDLRDSNISPILSCTFLRHDENSSLHNHMSTLLPKPLNISEKVVMQ